MPHNHDPRCCCEYSDYPDADGQPVRLVACPDCPTHSHPVNSPERECPHCHQAPDRPHTDYCPTRQPATYAGPTGRELPDEHWNARIIRETAATQTTQATATTSQPPTHTRAGILDNLTHYDVNRSGRGHLRALCRPDLCGQEPKREPTPSATPTPGTLTDPYERLTPERHHTPAGHHPRTECTPLVCGQYPPAT